MKRELQNVYCSGQKMNCTAKYLVRRVVCMAVVEFYSEASF